MRNIIGAIWNQGYDSVWNYGLEHGALIFLNAVQCIMCELATVKINYFQVSSNGGDWEYRGPSS